MLNYSKDGLTIAIAHDTRRALADGSYPVKIRATLNRTVKYFPTGKSLTTQEWSVLWSSRHKELSSIRKDIENSFELVRKAAEELLYSGDFSLDRLRDSLQRRTTFTLQDEFEAIIEEHKQEGKVRNASIYDNVCKGTIRYKGRTSLSDISTAWVRGYQSFLEGEGKSTTTIAIHLRTIRAVLNRAKSEGLIKESSYPFGRGKFEIQEGEGRKMALSLEHIGQIAHYDDGTELTQRYRDFWLFLYLCNGINVADFVQLRYKDIVGGELHFVRQKTSRTMRKRKEIVVVVTEQMQHIIKRWGNPPSPNSYIFPILTGKEDAELKVKKTQRITRAINQRMAKVGAALGLGNISTYTARHSFATVLKRAGANIAYISESLGHTDLKTTEHYLASFEREEREKNAALLTQW